MTIGGSARTGATSLAMVVGLVLAIALPRFLPLHWALLIAAGGALGVYLVLHVVSVAPFEAQFEQKMDESREQAAREREAAAQQEPAQSEAAPQADEGEAKQGS